MNRAAAAALGILALATLARAEAPPADAVLAELPFLDAPDDPGAPRIDLAEPGRRALPLLIDTGSPESFATPRAARALGLTVRRNKSTAYRRATRLGHDVEIGVDTRRGDTAAASGGEWAVLGTRFLARFVVEIDFPARRVRFLDPDRFAVREQVDAPGEQVLPLRLAGARPVVEIEVAGVRVPAVLTTGSPGTLLLPGGHAEGAALVADPEATKTLEPLPGAGALRAATAPIVRIGRFERADVPLLVAERGAQGAGPRSEAWLGRGLLDAYCLRLDFARSRVWIARPDVPEPPRAAPPTLAP